MEGLILKTIGEYEVPLRNVSCMAADHAAYIPKAARLLQQGSMRELSYVGCVAHSLALCCGGIIASYPLCHGLLKAFRGYVSRGGNLSSRLHKLQKRIPGARAALNSCDTR